MNVRVIQLNLAARYVYGVVLSILGRYGASVAGTIEALEED
jgi:hypothetical protein